MERASFERIRALVRERSAIVLEPGKEYLVEGRLQTILRARGYRSVDELCTRLASDSELAYEVVEAMTTNETSFFRDIYPFEALRTAVLPALVAAHGARRSLRIWCAACSTGQEPYSVAMVIRENFPDLASWNIEILATDISRQVLERARSGRFKQVEVNRGLSAQMMERYFSRAGLDFELSPQIREMVRFEELNLVQPWPRSQTFDIVLLRNVLIYFDQDVKRTILGKVKRQLRVGSYLFLGGSESLPAEETSFERLAIPRSGCYRLI